MTLDIHYLRRWVGRQETLIDQVTSVPIKALSATLDRDDPAPRLGDPLPPLWHWLYFLPTARQSDLGPDGHPKRGGFLPPVPLPRRMWAGGHFNFHQPLRVGERITRVSTVTAVTAKDGRNGPLCFVLVHHEISGENGVALTEEHDIVYRDKPAPGEEQQGQPPMAPADAVWRRDIVPDDVLLFRYSALTFNGHRIHYDRQYVTTEEGYPGLVVHGPLIATLLVDLLRRNSTATLKRFRFRALSPLFDIAPFSVQGHPGGDGRVALWSADSNGRQTMDAHAEVEE